MGANKNAWRAQRVEATEFDSHATLPSHNDLPKPTRTGARWRR